MKAATILVLFVFAGCAEDLDTCKELPGTSACIRESCPAESPYSYCFGEYLVLRGQGEEWCAVTCDRCYGGSRGHCVQEPNHGKCVCGD